MSCRTVSVTSTAASSLWVAMMTALAVLTWACSSVAERVAEPSTATSPSATAARMAPAFCSTTTIRSLSWPFSSSALTALRPLVP